MQPLTEEQLQERDKRCAAIHEAGHVVVAAIHDECNLGAYIAPTDTSDPLADKTWIGQAFGFTGGRHFSAVMAVAGCVAEWLEDDAELTAEDCSDYADDENSLSPTDRARFPTDYDEQLAAFDIALTILREHKGFFNWTVTQLLDDESQVVTEDMVGEYVRENNLVIKRGHHERYRQQVSVKAR
jgi:hypothetical protein